MIASSGGDNSVDANQNSRSEKSEDHPDSKLLGEVLQALKGLQFGEVLITVRDGRVVQIDRIARNRQILPKQR